MAKTSCRLLIASVALGAVAASGVGSTPLTLRGGAGDVVQLVTGAGELVASSASSVTSSLPGGSGVAVVASVGGSTRGRRLLNAVFGTSFGTEISLDAPSDADGGAYLAASPSTGALVVEVQPVDPPSGEQRSPADADKLASFSLALADAVIIHSPCVAPSAALLKETYERIFSHHLASKPAGSEPAGKTVLVHVSDSSCALSESDLARACKDAWAAAAAATEMKGRSFAEIFDLEVVSMPSSSKASAAEYEAGVTQIRNRLSGLASTGAGKVARPGDFAAAASAAWQSAGTLLDDEPSEEWLRDRFLAARSYEAAYSDAQSALRKWAPAVAKGKLVRSFGPAAAAMLDGALAAFDAGVSSCSAASEPMLTQRRTRLAKALHNDVQELFQKQHRQLAVSTTNRYKEQLVQCANRAGSVADWQRDGLRRSAEKHFDAAVGQLIVPGVGDATRAQLTSAFSKSLTELTSKFLESPPIQLASLSSMRRRTGKGQKPPRGIRAGVGLVGCVRSAFGGGQGNLQTYAGYTEGLNSAHIMFANDGLIADSSGSEPPFWRWQPKMNFDIAV